MVIFNERHPWTIHTFDIGTVYATTSIDGKSCYELLSKLDSGSSSDIAESVNSWLEGAKNHFAVICKYSDVILAIADRTAAFPVYISENANKISVSNHAPTLVNDMANVEKDADGLLSLEMAGYVTGKRSAVKGLNSLNPGEAVLIKKNKLTRWLYYKYMPKLNALKSSEETLIEELAETTLSILEAIKIKAEGRQIAVPLSAGLDSRLILSGLKHLGTKNLICFSYGHAMNFEAKTAQRIAKILDVNWHFIPLSLRQQRQFYRTSTYQNYLNFTHNFISTPFRQDLYPLCYLLDAGLIDQRAIVINGNSGDFISGGHIPGFITKTAMCNDDVNSEFIGEFLRKHFSLWEQKFSSKHYELMGKLLKLDINEDEVLNGDVPIYAIWEGLEFVNRQSKYVISGQRIYDFLCLDWELPLWHDAYMDFWAKVPLFLKANQSLYRSMLLQKNWGGVWTGIPINQKEITPLWIVPPRFLVKIACAPFGREVWHRIEKRFFAYWMDWGGNYAVIPFWKLAISDSVARNAVSVHTQAYLERIESEING